MKLQILAFALFMPLTTVSAMSLPQEPPAGSSTAPAASASTHHRPLFTFKYVLVREQPEAREGSRIEQNDDQAVIRVPPLSGGRWPVVQLSGGLPEPNMYLCRGWGCRSIY